MRCEAHDQEFQYTWDFEEHILNHHIYRMEQMMTELSSDQQHLETDVTQLTSAISTAVSELKAAIAANPGAPASSLDFTSLDALVTSTQAEAVADAPPTIPSDDPSLATPAAPVLSGAVSDSPFVADAPAEDAPSEPAPAENADPLPDPSTP